MCFPGGEPFRTRNSAGTMRFPIAPWCRSGISTMKHACRLRMLIAIAALVAGSWLCGAATCWGQTVAVGPAAGTGAPKKVSKVYIVGYTLVALMVGLGVLVVCHYRERKARPDLPQDMVAERLRQGIKAPPQQKSG